MFPNLSIATDNIYKFACLFGLALILASIFSFVSVYNYTLDKNIALSETIITIEAKNERSKIENDKLELFKKILEISNTNQKAANEYIGISIGIGLLLSVFGALAWMSKIQTRDDLLAELQIEKLRAEINILKRQSIKTRK